MVSNNKNFYQKIIKNKLKMKKLLPLLSIFLFFSCSELGEKLTFDGTEVYYNDGVTIEQAQKLGEYLIESKFTDGSEKSVQLVKDDTTGNLIFRMIINKTVDKNDVMFKDFAQSISKDIFNGKPVDMHLCDNKFKTLKVLLFSDF